MSSIVTTVIQNVILYLIMYFSRFPIASVTGQLLVQVRRTRPVHGRHQTPVGRADRRRGPGPVQPGGTRRHRAHGRLHGRSGERVQRGGQQVRR